MEFLSERLISPTGHYLQLLEVLAVMTYLIHLPYIGIVIGSTALAMWLTFSNSEIPNPNFERFASDLIETFLGNKVAIFVFGIFPLLVLPLIYAQWFAGTGATTLHYIPLTIPLVVLAFVLLFLYRSSFASHKTNMNTHLGMGTLGLLILIGAYFLLLSAVARLHDPEKWFRIKDVSVMLLNWNVIWKFLFFLHASFVVTGAGILFFFNWPGRAAMDAEYAAFVRRFASGIMLAFSFALPVFFLFYIFTSPDVVFDNTLYLLAALVAVLAMIGALVALTALGDARPRHGTRAIAVVLAMFLVASVIDLRAMSNANREHAHAAELATERERATREAELEALLHSGAGADVGEQVFNTSCVQCHRFDEKLVGPPLNSVLPKYAGDLEKLKQFLENPEKVDPAYPPMPIPGLTSAQINAVSEYVVQQLDGEAGGGH